MLVATDYDRNYKIKMDKQMNRQFYNEKKQKKMKSLPENVQFQGWGYSMVVEYLPSMFENLSSIPVPQRKKLKLKFIVN